MKNFMNLEKAFNESLDKLRDNLIASTTAVIVLISSPFVLIVCFAQVAQDKVSHAMMPWLTLVSIMAFCGIFGTAFFFTSNSRHPSPYDMALFAGITKDEWHLLSLDELDGVVAITRNADYFYMMTMLTRSVRLDQFLRRHKFRRKVNAVCRVHGVENSHVVALMLLKGVPLSVLVENDLGRITAIVGNNIPANMVKTLIENDIDSELSKSFIDGTLTLRAA